MLLLPQGIGYSLLAGIHPINGLISTALAGIFYAFFGGSKHLAIAPEALTTIVLQHVIYDIHSQNEDIPYVDVAIVLSLLSGLVFLAISLFKGMGTIHYLVSGSLLAGFEAAIG